MGGNDNCRVELHRPAGLLRGQIIIGIKIQLNPELFERIKGLVEEFEELGELEVVDLSQNTMSIQS